MTTIKFKYTVSSEDDRKLIQDCIRQYTNLYHVVYNRQKEGLKQKDIHTYCKGLNNIDLLDSWFIHSSLYDTKTLLSKDKVVFGGKKNLVRRCKGLISKEEYRSKRLQPLYSLGQGNVKGNRKFRINQDISLTFQPCKSTHITLKLNNISNRKRTLTKLFLAQESKSFPITYRISDEYVWIIFDETELYKDEYKVCPIKNRVMALDLNPNYIGWSVIDWKGEEEFTVVDKGVYSLKRFSDKDNELYKEHTDSTDPRKVYLHNKLTHEVLQISKNLIQKALHYRVEMFGLEDLTIKSGDRDKGKRINKLCNNLWVRNKLINNLHKRCNIFGIRFLEVKCAYSSFIGNFVYRNLDCKLPDSVLASIEIGRRAYEFNNQYITKVKEIKKNIITPTSTQFSRWKFKSLEEFEVPDGLKDWKEIYYFLKNSKARYRVPLEDCSSRVFRCFSKKSMVEQIQFV